MYTVYYDDAIIDTLNYYILTELHFIIIIVMLIIVFTFKKSAFINIVLTISGYRSSMLAVRDIIVKFPTIIP